MKNLLNDLNPQQITAVEAFQGPFLVIAGAGSGKTTALTRRIAYLICKRGISPHNILAVTFTNKAAAEMRLRISHLIDLKYAKPLVGTFHSVCAKILRDEIHHIGYDQNFSILDQHDQLVLIKKILKNLELSNQQFTPRSVLESISRAKNDLLSVDAFISQTGSYYEEKIGLIYDLYQKTLRENHCLDFDDIIRLTIALFNEHKIILEKYQERFHYVLVDEYQDTNHAQYTLIKMLTKKHQNIFVVGDDWQSIYKWRGADVNNILHFDKDYPGTTVIKLEQNYRSTQNILDAAYHIIKNNNERSEKRIWTEAEGGTQLTHYVAHDERDEAQFIVQKIQELSANGLFLSDFVILYRTNAQSRIIEEYFLKNSIGYRIVGGTKFYERKEIKDILAYLRLINNPANSISLERALSTPRRGIGSKTLEQWLGGSHMCQIGVIDFGISAFNSTYIKARSKQKVIHDFCTLIKNAQEYATNHDVTEVITYIYENSGLKKILLDGTIEGESRHENVQELLSVASKYIDMPNALQLLIEEISLVSDTDHIDQESQLVHLMTLHSAKGLEFPVVFIVGLEEGLIPHNRAMINEAEMEEERRLAYVGITRAKSEVYLLCARQRLLFGSLQSNSPSRFLDEIPTHLLNKTGNTTTLPPYQKHTDQRPQSVFDSPCDTKVFCDGDKVLHTTFGNGIVVGQTDTIVFIVFKNFGLKKLAKSIAPLTKIS